jgi:hypothetical protein
VTSDIVERPVQLASGFALRFRGKTGTALEYETLIGSVLRGARAPLAQLTDQPALADLCDVRERDGRVELKSR